MSTGLLKFKQWLQRWRNRFEHIQIDAKLQEVWQNTELSLKQNWQNLEYLIVDTETSSLDVNDGELLSIGWVTIKNGDIQISDARHFYIKGLMANSESVGDSAAIHQIRDCELKNGIYIEEAIFTFLEACRNKILVFHHAGLDLAFLNKHISRIMGAPLLIPHIDTLLLEKAKLSRQKDVLKKQDLTLGSCRERYGLPIYPAHNALNDALATAELLQAQIQHKGKKIRASELLA